MVLLTPWGELMIRILRGCRLGSGDAIAGRGVSGSGISEESVIKSSVIGVFLLFYLAMMLTKCDMFSLIQMSIFVNIYAVMSL